MEEIRGGNKGEEPAGEIERKGERQSREGEREREERKGEGEKKERERGREAGHAPPSSPWAGTASPRLAGKPGSGLLGRQGKGGKRESKTGGQQGASERTAPAARVREQLDRKQPNGYRAGFHPTQL